MQIISGRLDEATIHYEAPPSHLIPKEMDQFVTWWNETGPAGAQLRRETTSSSFQCGVRFHSSQNSVGILYIER